jgi:hypothetical protein
MDLNVPSLLNVTAQDLPCGGAVKPDFSVRWDGGLIGGEVGASYDVAVIATGGVRLWVHQWKLVDEWTNTQVQQINGSWNFTIHEGIHYPVRVEFISWQSSIASLKLLWRKVGATTFSPIPDSALAPHITAEERERQALQKRLAQGWNTWHRASAASHVHLPTGFGISLAVTDQDSNTTTTWNAVDKCLEEEDCKVRPGRHALNGSLTEITARIRPKTHPQPLNITTSTVWGGKDGKSLIVLLKSNVTGASAMRLLSVTATGSFFFDCGDRCGNVSVISSASASASAVADSTVAPPRLLAVPYGFYMADW